MYKPRLFSNCCGSEIKITPSNPKIKRKKIFKLIFSLKIIKARIDEKKTFVKLTVLAWERVK